MRFDGRNGAGYVDLNKPLTLGLGGEQGAWGSFCRRQRGNLDARHPGQRTAWAQAASSPRSLRVSLASTLAGRKKRLWLLGCKKPFEWHQRRGKKMSKSMQS